MLHPKCPGVWGVSPRRTASRPRMLRDLEVEFIFDIDVGVEARGRRSGSRSSSTSWSRSRDRGLMPCSRSKSPIALAAARVSSGRSSLYGSGSGGRPSGYGASGKGPLDTGSIRAPRSRFSFGDDAPVAPPFDATARLPAGGDK